MKYKINEERLGEHDIPVLLQCIANELSEANRLKRLEILWGGRVNHIRFEAEKKLMGILKDPDDTNLDLEGDYDE